MLRVADMNMEQTIYKAVSDMARYIDADLLLTDEKTHTLPIGCGKASGNVVVFLLMISRN